MKILEYIKQIILGNKKTATIYTKKLTKKYGELTPLSIGLYDHKEPLPNRTILINVNGKDYERKTNEQGIAILNINLPPGEYTPLITFADDDDYNLTTAFTKIEITTDTYVDGINLTKTFGDNTPYQCAVYDKYTGQRIAGTVNLTINGKTYARTPDITGLYKLNINLNPGTYTLKAEYLGDTIHLPSAITNTITINQPPEPEPEPELTPEPQKSRSEKILDEYERYFGRCEYIDDALEKIQGNGYAFYFSDGYNMYETIRKMANGEGANCYDSAEVFYHLARGMNSKYGRNYDVQYLDVWCPKSRYDHIRIRLNTGSGWFYRDPACVLDGGDITSNWCGTSDNIIEVNPDWIYDGD